MLSIERMVMSERSLVGAQSNGAETSVRERTLMLFVRGVLQGNLAPRGWGGGQRAVGRTDPSAQARGARTDGASGGRGGEGVAGMHMAQN